MNIFEYLGLPADHRKESKVTQLVKHFDEVTEKNKKGKRLGVQLKKDGVCALTVIQDGNATIFSRTGKAFANVGNITQSIEECLLRDGVYMGELCVPKSIGSLEQLSGVVNPNRTNPLKPEVQHFPGNMEMHFFDLISIESFIEGASQTTFQQRYTNLCERNRTAEGVYVLIYSPVSKEADIDTIFNFAVDRGEEGIVIRDLDSDWSAGHKGYRAMKKVRGVDYDLRCIGYEEGTGKYAGKVANLIFEWKGGETIKCMLGKGWTHNDAEDMFHAAVSDNYYLAKDESPVGKIFQVYALQESSKGKLRLAKVGEQRHDKDESDV